MDLEKEVSAISSEVQALQNMKSQYQDDLAKINKMEADIFDRYQFAGVKLSNGKRNQEDINNKMLAIEAQIQKETSRKEELDNRQKLQRKEMKKAFVDLQKKYQVLTKEDERETQVNRTNIGTKFLPFWS